MVQLEPLLAVPAVATTAPRDDGDVAAAPGEAPSFQDFLRGSPLSPANSDPPGKGEATCAAQAGASHPAGAAAEGDATRTTENQLGSGGKPADPCANGPVE